MKKVMNFVINRGFTFMLCGMLTAITGVISYMVFSGLPRYRFTPLPQASIVLAITGFSIYFIGRIALAAQRNRTRHTLSSRNDDDKD
ncbi:MAG: hypothetical protein LBC70_00845 [Chitinispirillales bacterium]|jgi:hypothetical protein|nr:hypothetical protein [Chitinispirillales bacterium]